MANCKHCGKPAGLLMDEHLYCAQGVAQGISAEEAEMRAAQVRTGVAKPVGFNTIVGGVFVALWLWTLSAGVVVVLFRILTSQ